jgi:hypothetical protein
VRLDVKKIVIILCILVCSSLIFTGNGYARVSGACSDCHTMHYSQNGTTLSDWGSAGPYNVLLINNCLGCHSSTDNSEAVTSLGAPVVYTIGSAPDFGFQDAGSNYHGLAGGNFYWVKTDDNKGHNVFSDNPDETLTTAPGGDSARMSCGAQSCHKNISETETTEDIYYGRQGCTKCHMLTTDGKLSGFHHADDSNTVVGCDVGDTDGFYRFLSGHLGGAGRGACGIEDNDWQETYAADDHNEYLGYSGTKTSDGWGVSNGHTVTFFCCGCHGAFHIEQDAGGTWVRHPSDAVIPNTGEYSDAFGAGGTGTGTYNPQVPVARHDLSGWTGPSATVTINDDLVMCLSCHRPHGTPYPDMLRWDYDGMVAGSTGASGGCFVCHTQKNQTP